MADAPPLQPVALGGTRSSTDMKIDPLDDSSSQVSGQFSLRAREEWLFFIENMSKALLYSKFYTTPLVWCRTVWVWGQDDNGQMDKRNQEMMQEALKHCIQCLEEAGRDCIDVETPVISKNAFKTKSTVGLMLTGNHPSLPPSLTCSLDRSLARSLQARSSPRFCLSHANFIVKYAKDALCSKGLS